MSARQLYILLLARDPPLRKGLDTLLSQCGHMVLPLDDVEEARSILRRPGTRPDVVVVERGMVEIKPSSFRLVEVGEPARFGGAISYEAADVIRRVEDQA